MPNLADIDDLFLQAIRLPRSERTAFVDECSPDSQREDHQMETIGFVFGMLGMSLAIIGWGLVGSLRKEFEDLKKNLEDSGVLKDQTES